MKKPRAFCLGSAARLPPTLTSFGCELAARSLATAHGRPSGGCFFKSLKLFARFRRFSVALPCGALQPSIELRPMLVNYLLKILSSGSLGSGVDEERSKLRVSMRTAGHMSIDILNAYCGPSLVDCPRLAQGRLSIHPTSGWH